ncbi:hypothetical protein EVAR_103568_1 [Eumeta japonica]|uniref:DUF6570 domain-containing protein n=1 Tax=Eumeta variegata TaxID=151549 RepID=A0A4C1ZY44_EUMVA|nr:hypothetical protein EVAR_103568_1 [Eumeta japonica]
MGKTNAKHFKNYYNRKKAAKEAEKIRQGFSVEKPIKKTGAERTRAYRLRKIMLSQANESSVNDISSIPSTSNSRIRTFEPSFQLATTSASTNRPDVSTVSSTGIADHDGDNLRDSFLSTSTHDNRNSIIVQAEVHMANSPVLYNHSTAENFLLTDMEQNRLLQAQETNKQSADAPNIHILSTQDIVRDQECDLLNQDIIMDQELPPPDGQAIHSNSPEQFINTPIDEQIDVDVDTSLPYSNFRRLKRAHQEFKIKFLDNSFGYPCSVCDRLWFRDDLKSPSPEHKEILTKLYPIYQRKYGALQHMQALNKKNIPLMSTFNGFKYPDVPQHLPPLDLVSERLISPRIPFMQIRRLRHVNADIIVNEEQYLRIAPGENNVPESLLFDEHAEELSLPAIYLGQFRNFKEGVKVTPFMMASSELRRSDRRAVTPYHLLYMAMKIMRMRVRDSLTVAFKHHRGSPHAHISLWLANAPMDALDKNRLDSIALIDYLISVSSREASDNIKLQRHKHTFTCFKKIVANQPQHCRFEAPFMPCRSTTILLPMQKEEPGFKNYAKRYKDIRINLENNDYHDIDSFYQSNKINSDDDYHNILRAGIKRPRVFVKCQPCEKWHNPFNPFIFNIVKSNMDIQFIAEEYSCASYVAEYVNKTNRGISHLQRLIIETMNEYPEFDVVEITRKIGVNMLNSAEITSQEAAWYLLREPMSKCSTVVTSIPTMWPCDRQRIRKTQKELDAIGVGEDSTNIWKENWFDKYERRHEDLENITLAQFVANYTVKADGTYKKKKSATRYLIPEL